MIYLVQYIVAHKIQVAFLKNSCNAVGLKKSKTEYTKVSEWGNSEIESSKKIVVHLII